jgi:hypothetical protein
MWRGWKRRIWNGSKMGYPLHPSASLLSTKVHPVPIPRRLRGPRSPHRSCGEPTILNATRTEILTPRFSPQPPAIWVALPTTENNKE